jgi:acyl carrier protein
MNSSTNIETMVIDVIRRELHAADPKVDARTRLVDDLGADSRALVELLIVFEETFDIDIPDAEAEKIRTVRDAIIAVEKCLRTGDRAVRS